MSELKPCPVLDAILRLEAWVRNFGHEKQKPFIDDVSELLRYAREQYSRPESEAERVLREWGEAMLKWSDARRRKHPDWTKVHQLQASIEVWKSEAEQLARKLAGEGE